MRLDEDVLDDLSLGSVFLATGGGGDPYVSLLATRQVLHANGPAEMIPVDELDDDAYVVTIGAVGAPSVSLELLPSVHDAEKALRAYEEHVGRSVDAVVSFEVGGGNSLIPIAAASACGIPVIDGDGMARALPEAQMMTYPISGISPTPALALDYAGNVMTFASETAEAYEHEIRAAAEAMGGMITAVEHPMSGAELKTSVMRGTISFSIELGRLLRERRGNAERLLAPLTDLFADSLYGQIFPLYTGKVVDYSSSVVAGFDQGQARLEPFDQDGPAMTIDIRNEFLVARMGGEVVASVPDLITMLDLETGTPINAERLRYGQRVAVYGVGCPEFYRQPKALAVVEPRCFGFDIDFVPIEDLRPGWLQR